jgi:tRNA-Thr(GGU) m(6)t(6)A37 methyltransferase TsaA
LTAAANFVILCSERFEWLSVTFLTRSTSFSKKLSLLRVIGRDSFVVKNKKGDMMHITMKPIGFAHTDYPETIPRHWTVSDVEGRLVIHEEYQEGLRDIRAEQRIVVLFHFDRSPEFTSELLIQIPPHHGQPKGVFSTCSPRRPNPIGMSVLEVLRVEGNVIHVKRIDMLDGTPILDIKPHVEEKQG